MPTKASYFTTRPSCGPQTRPEHSNRFEQARHWHLAYEIARGAVIQFRAIRGLDFESGDAKQSGRL